MRSEGLGRLQGHELPHPRLQRPWSLLALGTTLLSGKTLDDRVMPWWEMKMSGRVWVMALWRFAPLALASCGGCGSSVTDCPSYIVVPDGGANGFSSVGEWRTDAVCAVAGKTSDAATIFMRFIDPNYPLGRAVNLASCRSNSCSQACGVPF